MLMAIDDLEVKAIISDEEVVEVALEGEIVSALEELETTTKKNQSKKELPNKEKAKAIEPLLLQIEEDKKIQESLNQKLSEKDQACERLEGEIFLPRKELENDKAQFIFNKKIRKGIDNLNDILEA